MTQADQLKSIIQNRQSEKQPKVVGALMYGDLRSLTDAEKISYYTKVCESVGLNYLTLPFQFIKMNGKEILYAGKNCCEQLRSVHNISIKIKSRDIVDDMLIVTSTATNLKTLREDESIGAVCFGGLKGEAKANSFMKAETKSKRRVTLSICGLGMLDETEVEDIPNVVQNNAVMEEFKERMYTLGKEFEKPMDDIRQLYDAVRKDGFTNGQVEKEMRSRLTIS